VTQDNQHSPQEFSERLNLALDQLGWPRHGRIANLARAMSDDLASTSVRRWLTGKGLPEVKRLGELAKITQKSVQWLLTGSSPDQEDYAQPKLIRRITQLHAFRIDGLPSPDFELIALCDDGSIWDKKGIHNGAEWVKIDGIPQYDLLTEGKSDE